MIECEDPEPNVKHDARVREMYLVVMKKFLQVTTHSMINRIIADDDSMSRLWPKVVKSGVVVEPF